MGCKTSDVKRRLSYGKKLGSSTWTAPLCTTVCMTVPSQKPNLTLWVILARGWLHLPAATCRHEGRTGEEGSRRRIGTFPPWGSCRRPAATPRGPSCPVAGRWLWHLLHATRKASCIGPGRVALRVTQARTCRSAFLFLNIFPLHVHGEETVYLLADWLHDQPRGKKKLFPWSQS